MIRGTHIPFPSLVDSTMRASFVACEAKFWYEWMRRLTKTEVSTDLLAGGAFAHGLEAARLAYYAEALSAEDALIQGVTALTEFYSDHEPNKTNPKTWARMVGALDYYLQVFPFATDKIQPYIAKGKPAVEFTFAVPIPDTAHPETGDPILYGGRTDMIGQYNQALFVVDEKTTKQLGGSWIDQWSLRGQLIGYSWAAQTLGNLPVAGVFIRGVSILKTKYGHAEVIVYTNKWLIERWLEQLSIDINNMIRCWKSGRWSQNFDQACNAYGGCQIKMLCESANPEPWIKQFFIRNTWNPLQKNPEEVKQKDTILPEPVIGKPHVEMFR